jgi:DNA end-binding protein Ku
MDDPGAHRTSATGPSSARSARDCGGCRCLATNFEERVTRPPALRRGDPLFPGRYLHPRGRLPPGTVQLAEPPRPGPAPSAVRAANPEEDNETEEEQDRAEDAEEEEQEQNAAPLVPRPQNTRTIEIERFVPAGQVDVRYLEKPYYVVPRDAIGQEAFAVIRDAMSREKVDGLGRVVLSSRERPMLVAVMGNGLCGVTLRFAHEVRKQAEYYRR